MGYCLRQFCRNCWDGIRVQCLNNIRQRQHANTAVAVGAITAAPYHSVLTKCADWAPVYFLTSLQLYKGRETAHSPVDGLLHTP